MRGLGLAGGIALVFGLLAYYATEELGPFAWINLGTGAAALAVAALLGLRNLRELGTSNARRVLAPRLLWLLLALAAGVGLERLLAHAEPIDLTTEDVYQLAPATRETLATLPEPVSATLYYEKHDPRTRRIGLLLERMAAEGPLRVRRQVMEQAVDAAERFGLSYSNSVVFERGERWSVVERPAEGSLLGGLRDVLVDRESALYVTRGEGEGSLQRSDDAGYSGLGAALSNEGYVLRDLVTAAIEEVPDDAAAVLVLDPKRDLRDTAYAAFDRYLARGGRMLVLAEPDSPPGLLAFLARWGFDLPEGVLVDPASGPSEGAPPGVNVIVYVYDRDHPVTRRLDDNTMTFFPRVRPVVPARKPQPQDRLSGLAYSSPRSWLSPRVDAVARGLAPDQPPDAVVRRHPLAAMGRYDRDGGEARAVVIGDADFASNQYLRALYNLDLAINAVHWLTERDDAITLRPKALTPDQAPFTPQQTLSMLYGVGLLLPELLLIAGAWTWVRRRGA